MSRHALIAVLCLSLSSFASTPGLFEPQESSSEKDAPSQSQPEQSSPDVSVMPESTQAPPDAEESEDESASARTCCKVCKKGCPCGDSCISCSKVCHKGLGCAC